MTVTNPASVTVRTFCRYPLATLLWRVSALRGAPRLHLGEHVVIDATDSGMSGDARMKMGAAVGLISQGPASIGRMVRNSLSRIIVADVGGPIYVEAINAALLPENYVRDRAPVRIAATLVHEACHARLHLRGHFYQPGNKRRIELICLRTELRFLNAMPDADEWAQLVEVEIGRLASGDLGAWSIDAVNRRTREVLRRSGLPAWIIGPLYSFTVWRRARRGETNARS